MLNVYTDGSCKPNPGPAGAAYYFTIDNTEYSGAWVEHSATNNIAELMAVKIVFDALIKLKLDDVIIHTDSKYAIGVLSLNWKAKINKELIKEIKFLISQFTNLKFQWVKGHANNLLNEKVDQLANQQVDLLIRETKSKLVI